MLYFLDGDALFSDSINQGWEWQVDEVIDSLSQIGGPEVIVIGIENAENRTPEYPPFLSPFIPELKEVTGDKQAEWIATDLKTWVGSTYRTKPEPENTTIGGASLGGLMAYYMIMTYPETFQNAIVFSPSLWVNEKVFSLHQQIDNFSKFKIYLNVGDREFNSMVPDAKKLNTILQKQGMNANQLQFDIEANAGHDHLTWRKGFKKAFPWIVQQ